ncbi:MAG: YciI family protein [Pseudomonadota bacterium]
MKKYLVLTQRTASFDPACLDPHYAFLDALKKDGRLEQFGGFSDKSGGAYVFKAHNFNEAKTITENDPVFTTGSSTLTVYEWNAQT